MPKDGKKNRKREESETIYQKTCATRDCHIIFCHFDPLSGVKFWLTSWQAQSKASGNKMLLGSTRGWRRNARLNMGSAGLRLLCRNIWKTLACNFASLALPSSAPLNWFLPSFRSMGVGPTSSTPSNYTENMESRKKDLGATSNSQKVWNSLGPWRWQEIMSVSSARIPSTLAVWPRWLNTTQVGQNSPHGMGYFPIKPLGIWLVPRRHVVPEIFGGQFWGVLPVFTTFAKNKASRESRNIPTHWDSGTVSPDPFWS